MKSETLDDGLFSAMEEHKATIGSTQSCVSDALGDFSEQASCKAAQVCHWTKFGKTENIPGVIYSLCVYPVDTLVYRSLGHCSL